MLETNAPPRRWFSMADQDPHLSELIQKVERALGELKAYANRGDTPAPGASDTASAGGPAAATHEASDAAAKGAAPAQKHTVKAFADEAFRSRDA